MSNPYSEEAQRHMLRTVPLQMTCYLSYLRRSALHRLEHNIDTTTMRTPWSQSFAHTFMNRVWYLQLLTLGATAAYGLTVAIATKKYGLHPAEGSAPSTLLNPFLSSIAIAFTASFAALWWLCDILCPRLIAEVSMGWWYEPIKISLVQSLWSNIFNTFLWPLGLKQSWSLMFWGMACMV